MGKRRIIFKLYRSRIEGHFVKTLIIRKGRKVTIKIGFLWKTGKYWAQLESGGGNPIENLN